MISTSKPRYRYSHASSRWLPACARSQHIGIMLISTHRGRSVIHSGSNGIYKTRAAYVAEALGGRWSNRADGYVMSSRSRADAAARLNGSGSLVPMQQQPVAHAAGSHIHSLSMTPPGAMLIAGQP